MEASREQGVSSDFIVESVYRLVSKIIWILGAIVLLAFLAFLSLVVAYLWLLLGLPGSERARPDAALEIQQVMFTMWDKLVPIGENVLRVVAPVVVLLLAVVALLVLSRYGAAPFDLGRLMSDLPSVLALLIVVTICLLPLAGLAVPEVLSNIALVVVGFYFGKRKASREPDGDS